MATKIVGNLILSQSTEETTLSHVLTYNTQSGRVAYTASSALGGGSGASSGNQYEIQYSSDGAGGFGAIDEFTFNPTVTSLNVGMANDMAAGSRVLFVGEGHTNRGSNSVVIGAGSSISPSGINSLAVGDTAAASGYATIAAGINTFVAGSGSVVFGWSNTVNGSASLATGVSNTINGDTTFVIGSSNTVAARNSVVIGETNTDIDGDSNLVVGNTNRSTAASSDSLVVGQGNGVTNLASATIGINNINSGSGTLVVGSSNRMTNATALAIGTSNFSTQANTFLIGFFLSASSQYQTFVGQYNNATNTPDGAPSGLLFGVGGGIGVGSRRTVFAITVDINQSGSMRIPHNPNDPNGAGNTITTGSMYYDTTNNRIRIWNGSAWRTIATT
jgi:hypothetical protein